eukprot:Awhi_evm1s3144
MMLDVPLTGETQRWNEVDEDEDLVKEIIGHREVHHDKNVPSNEFHVLLMDGRKVWYREKELDCDELIMEFDKKRKADDMIHYKSNKRILRAKR